MTTKTNQLQQMFDFAAGLSEEETAYLQKVSDKIDAFGAKLESLLGQEKGEAQMNIIMDALEIGFNEAVTSTGVYPSFSEVLSIYDDFFSAEIVLKEE